MQPSFHAPIHFLNRLCVSPPAHPLHKLPSNTPLCWALWSTLGIGDGQDIHSSVLLAHSLDSGASQLKNKPQAGNSHSKCYPYVIEGGDPVQDQETSPGAVHVCSVTSDSYPMDCNLPGSSVEFFSQEYWSVGCYFLLQGIFPTPGSNPHLHWQVGSLLLSPGGRDT